MKNLSVDKVADLFRRIDERTVGAPSPEHYTKVDVGKRHYGGQGINFLLWLDANTTGGISMSMVDTVIGFENPDEATLFSLRWL